MSKSKEGTAGVTCENEIGLEFNGKLEVAPV